MVAALLCLLVLGYTSGRSPQALGAIFLVASLELILGIGIAGRLLVAKRLRPRVFRPVVALSTSLLAAELLILGTVIALGWN
jgi:hypothetical protein